MNKATTIDQELKQYLENIEKGQAENTAENLYNLRNRYGFDIKTSYSDAHECLKQIYDIQVQSDEILNPKAERFETFDGHVYGVKLDCKAFKIGDEVWNPLSGCPMIVHEDNIDFANEEYWEIVSIEEEPELPVAREWSIEVCRTAYAHRTIKVKALTYEDACELACDEAGGFEFSESDAEYSAQ